MYFTIQKGVLIADLLYQKLGIRHLNVAIGYRPLIEILVGILLIILRIIQLKVN